MSENNIIVTGFGPFKNHLVNASWESVKLLPQKIVGYDVIIEEIPVAYEAVDSRVNALWEQYNPRLVIHVGVSSLADKITLETCAYKDGYSKKDCLGNVPATGDECPVDCKETCINMGINVENICDYLNTAENKACVSYDAGRYLCEYIFYTSLSINKNKTMFIHVPPLGKPFSAEEIAQSILEIIERALQQDSKEGMVCNC